RRRAAAGLRAAAGHLRPPRQAGQGDPRRAELRGLAAPRRRRRPGARGHGRHRRLVSGPRPRRRRPPAPAPRPGPPPAAPGAPPPRGAGARRPGAPGPGRRGPRAAAGPPRRALDGLAAEPLGRGDLPPRGEIDLGRAVAEATRARGKPEDSARVLDKLLALHA